MVSANTSSAAVTPEFIELQSQDGPLRIRYSRAVLEDVRRIAVDRFLAIPRGGLEIGGVLFGRIRDGVSTITAHRQLELQYASGPSFVLSATDEESLIALIANAASDPELSGLEPVGWYHTHTRSDLSLSEADAGIHRRFFPGPEQFAIVIKPYKFDPAQAAVYAPGEGGGEPELMATFVLAAGAEGVEHDPAAAPEPADVGSTPHAPATAAPAEQVYTAPVLRNERRARRRTRMLVAAGAAVCAVAAGIIWIIPREVRRAEAPPPPLTHVKVTGSADRNVRIEWEGVDSPAAELQIVDGERATTVPLLPPELNRGKMTYVRTSGSVEVRLKMLRTDGQTAEEVSRFIGPEPAPPQSTSEIRVPVGEPSPPAETSRRELPPQPVKVAAVQQQARRTATPPPVRQVAPQLDAQLPAINAPAALRAPMGAATQALPPPPPQAASPGRQVTVPTRNPPAPVTGRAIWTGHLSPGSVLVLDGSRPSMGALTGRMPAGPMRLRVYPADLAESGIVAYGDREHVEPPSAANGWNVLAYRADPKRSRDVTVLESPALGNDWKRLMLQANNRTVSTIIIDWQQLP